MLSTLELAALLATLAGAKVCLSSEGVGDDLTALFRPDLRAPIAQGSFSEPHNHDAVKKLLSEKSCFGVTFPCAQRRRGIYQNVLSRV